MIIKEEFLTKLRMYFSLNLYEVKIWTALLSRGVATAGELSDISNVPRSRSYDVLESLEKKGFVIMKFGKPIKYLAVSPEEVVERVKKNMLKDAKDKIKRLDTLKTTTVLDELRTLHKQGIELVEPSEKSGSIRGRHNLYNHLEYMIKGAEESVTMMTTPQGFIRKVEALKPIFEQLKKRGVKIRIATEINDECVDSLKEIEGIAEVRNIKDINARFVIVDSKEITFMLMNDNEVHPTYDMALWVNTPYFAKALEDLFELAWRDMTSIKQIEKH